MKNLQQTFFTGATALAALAGVACWALHVWVIWHLPNSSALPERLVQSLLVMLVSLGIICNFLYYRIRRNVRQIWPETGYFSVAWKISSLAPRWQQWATWLLFAYVVLSAPSYALLEKLHILHTGAAPQLVMTAMLSFAFTSIASIYRLCLLRPEILQTKHCPNGHKIASMAKYCPSCGPVLSGTWRKDAEKPAANA
jgi:hypothetical protein